MKRLARNLAALATFILLAAGRSGASARPLTKYFVTFPMDIKANKPVVVYVPEGKWSRIDALYKATHPTVWTEDEFKLCAPCQHTSLDSHRDLSLYPPVARASIRRGLADGHVRFEPSQYGGEYIWSDGVR